MALRGIDAFESDAVVDVGAGPTRAHYRCDGLAPTVTAARGGSRGYWLAATSCKSPRCSSSSIKFLAVAPAVLELELGPLSWRGRLLPRHLLALQGLKREWLRTGGMSPHKLGRCAGNAMTAPVLAAVVCNALQCCNL